MQTVVKLWTYSTDYIGGGDLVNICLGPGEKLYLEESRLCKFGVAGDRLGKILGCISRVYPRFRSPLFNSLVNLLGVNASRLLLCVRSKNITRSEG